MHRVWIIQTMHRIVAFTYLILSTLSFGHVYNNTNLLAFFMFLSPLSSIILMLKLPPRWFHLHFSSLMTCFWCLTVIYWKEWLIPVWLGSILHYTYRCSQLDNFHAQALAKLDKRYLMVPVFGKFACTILTEIAKFMVQKDSHALALGFCSNMAIYGTILLKHQFSYKQFIMYNIVLSTSTFIYLYFK